MRQMGISPLWGRRLAAGSTGIAYAALVFALPFLGDVGVPTVLVVILWIGGSYVAGMLAPWYLMAIFPIAAAVVFVIVIERGAALDSEFFADPLSILAIPPVAAGELVALYFGSQRSPSRI